jgi:predicted dehydrogenase
MSSFSFAVVGCGSIGKRHIRNLRALGIHSVFGIDTDADRRQEAAESGAIPVSSLQAAFDAGVNVVFITLPNRLHKTVLEEAIKAECHIFVEKPIAADTEDLDAIVRDVGSKHLVAYMGSNWKFHPSFKVMKEILPESVGRVISARAIAGQYLPDWHPWEDYRKGYSANKSLGGGILLDSHEINYMTWLLAPACEVACMAGKLSDLEIDTEDTAALILRLKTGTLLEIHLDYNLRLYQRAYDFHGTTGFLTWDYRQGAVRLYDKITDKWTTWETPPGYDINQMYLDQTQHFLDCLEGKAEPLTPLSEGLAVLKVIEAAKRSSESRKFEVLH